MKIATRGTLKAFFEKGKQPTDRHFELLINSAVNKKDDCFFGKWVAGTNYPEGAVVYSNKSLYLLRSTATFEEDLCKEPAETDETPAPDYCSKEVPEIDDNWCQLNFNDPTAIDIIPFESEESVDAGADEVKASDIRKLLEALDLKYATDEENETKTFALYLNEGYDYADIPWQEMIQTPPAHPDRPRPKNLDSKLMIGFLFQTVKNQQDQINDLKTKLDQISTLVEAEASNGTSNDQ